MASDNIWWRSESEYRAGLLPLWENEGTLQLTLNQLDGHDDKQFLFTFSFSYKQLQNTPFYIFVSFVTCVWDWESERLACRPHGYMKMVKDDLHTHLYPLFFFNTWEDAVDRPQHFRGC